jgi:hypothetical protein
MTSVLYTVLFPLYAEPFLRSVIGCSGLSFSPNLLSCFGVWDHFWLKNMFYGSKVMYHLKT